MATLVLSAAGAALGGSFGGSIAGLSTMALGKAAGATLGNSLDQSLLGAGAAPVEMGKVEQFKVMGASEGTALPRVYGRARIAGQLIWSGRFLESVSEENVGGKGGGGPSVREYSYSISIAVAICEGEVVRVGRIWADGQPMDQSGLNWRLYRGSADQTPDQVIEAIEGTGNAPAYRGTAYAVFENLELGPFGNRIPQFSFEVFRRSDVVPDGQPQHPALDVRGVALVPGTGEYSLATTPVRFERGKGAGVVANINNDSGVPDILASLDQLSADLPNAKAVSLVVTWFGDDLRCDRCELYPAVEQNIEDGDTMPWQVAGASRDTARVVTRVDGRPVFGGTPTDSSVVQSIRHMNGQGQRVMFYPFILMDIQANNGLQDPWSGTSDQPVIPWRGRITLSNAPGVTGSPDKTSQAADEVKHFFGQAKASDFSHSSGKVTYSGPPEWSYRRFVLHYAHLCALAGGVDAFCLGSELRSLTRIRDSANGYPAVRALCALAEDVRSILGSDVRIGYAADWSEYFGHHPSDGSNDVLFNLDPLWAHPEIDFIGIDNYMPLSDWRDGSEHRDVANGSIYNLEYLKNGIEGGEGYDWYYADEAGRQAQERIQISDTAHGEDWVFRYKDIRSWWSEPHFDRLGGVRSNVTTDWVPQSKPVWFTEIGCPAVDKGTNQPNVFSDPKSSESFFPHYSSGAKDEFIQYRYLQAMFSHWENENNNPTSTHYGGPMVDMDQVFVWAWDARPWPDFPYRLETWSDGDNYDRGHWLNGRATNNSLAEVAAAECVQSGMWNVDCSALHGGTVGFAISGVQSTRQSLQPLMLAYGFDGFSINGTMRFLSRGSIVGALAEDGRFAAVGDGAVVARTRKPILETVGRAGLTFIRSDQDYVSGAAEASDPDLPNAMATHTNLPIVLNDGEARGVVDRWLAESQVARETVEFALPPSDLSITVGDVLRINGVGGGDNNYRIDRIDEVGHRQVTAVRVSAELYRNFAYDSELIPRVSIKSSVPPFALFLDLPLLTGDEIPHAPYVAVTQSPWTGPIAVYGAANDYDYGYHRSYSRPAIMGELVGPLPHGRSGQWMNASVRVRLASGALQSRSAADVLNGANVAAVGNGDIGGWEVLQFCDAKLVGEQEYLISGFLRGQVGTDTEVPAVWPPGTEFVFLNGAVSQVELPGSARGQMRHYRIGPAAKAYDSREYSHRTETVAGIGLRPYAPVHLKAVRASDGSIELSWIRRTRLEGDGWSTVEVPLGETSEIYHVRILHDDELLREFETAVPFASYSIEQQIIDSANGLIAFEIAQVSERFGPGLYQRIVFNV